jgi:hypothetical protein
MQTI